LLELILGMSVLEQFFLTCALSGSIIFVIRMAMLFAGLGGDHGDGEIDHDGSHDLIGDSHDIDVDVDGDVDIDGDLDVDADVGDASHDLVEAGHDSHSLDNSDFSFKFASLQGLTAFFMMFGWVGLAIIRDSGLPGWAAVFGGCFAGVVTVYIIAFMFRFFISLQSDGTMRVKNALGAGGEVYLRIPAEGSGQVQVEVDGRLKIFDAVSASKEEIKTGEQVTVVWVQDNGVLVVEKDERDRGGKLCGR
jgi:membrane protein implicated in regulation of membrane protease activity